MSRTRKRVASIHSIAEKVNSRKLGSFSRKKRRGSKEPRRSMRATYQQPSLATSYTQCLSTTTSHTSTATPRRPYCTPSSSPRGGHRSTECGTTDCRGGRCPLQREQRKLPATSPSSPAVRPTSSSSSSCRSSLGSLCYLGTKDHDL